MAGLGSCSVKAQLAKGEAINVLPSTISVVEYQKSKELLIPTSPAWVGSTPGQAGGTTGGGSAPAFNSSTNTLIFSYGQGTAMQTITAQAYALQHALDLSNSGVKIGGYNYSWKIDNSGTNSGSLSAAVELKGSGGIILEQFKYNYDAPTDGFELKTGTEKFRTDHELLNLQSISLSFTGKDSRFWAGYWGPRVREPSLTMNYTVDLCSANPLSSPSCAGYATAYLTQQCTGNPLYNSACPGYAEAVFTQQCTANVLSNPSCPGYAPAYLTYQCTVNPLFSTTCAGYETAYFNQQCSINPLYNTRCSGYATAYKTQQCTAMPLSATDCPGYAQAYLDSQCIKDSLFSKDCKGYATAYAIKYLVTGIDSTVVNQSLSNTAAVKANDPTTVKVATNIASTTINTDGSVSTGVSVTGDTNVDKAITSKASTTNATPTAVQLAPPPPAPQQQMSQNEPRGGNKQEDKKDDAPKGTGGNSPPQNTNNTQASSDKPAAPTARQELQARREAAAKAEAVEKGKNLAGEMGKASDLEAQKQVQNVVIQAMGFTPGFDAYSRQLIVQQEFYKPYQVYGNQKTIDNRANLRMFGGTDRLHNDMVESQYNKRN